jgi:hypothetical protein
MKAIIAIAIALALSACAHQNAGIRVYETAITKTDKGGEKSKSHLIASISADIEGVSSIEAGPVRLVFQPGGKFIASKVIKAQGEANKETVDSIAAGVTGGILSAGGVAATAGALGAVGAIVP